MSCRIKRYYLRGLSIAICVLMTMQSAIAGQVSGISILVVDGNKAQYLISEPAPKSLAVRVVDSAGVPLENASVLFVPPEYGPGGEFAKISGPVTVTTNRQGMATSPPFVANSTPGDFEIQVIASYMGQVTRLLLEQSNVEKRKSSKKLIILSAVLGGAAVAAFAAKGGGDSPSSPPPPVGSTSVPPIVFLNSSVGAPQ